MSITPAFSPGPWIPHGALVGSPRRWMRDDLYEQCSFHIAEKIPSSVKLGSRPISARMRWDSPGVRPCWGSGEDTAELQAHRYLHSFPTLRSSDLVLVPHRREDSELGEARLASDQREDALVLVGLEAVL